MDLSTKCGIVMNTYSTTSTIQHSSLVVGLKEGVYWTVNTEEPSDLSHGSVSVSLVIKVGDTGR